MKTVVVIAVIAGAAIGGLLGVRAWTKTRPPFGGVGGCSYVRDYAAQRACYEDRIRAMADDRSPRSVAIDIARRAARDTTLASFCHEALHPLGERVGEEAARSSTHELPIIRNVEDNCLQGYSHGVMLGAYGAMPLTKVVGMAGKMCAAGVAATTPLDCLHAVGHLIFRRSRSIEQSLNSCSHIDVSTMAADKQVRLLRQAFPNTWEMHVREECNKGVAMEFAFARLATQKHNPAEGATRMCNGVVKHIEACGRFIPLTASLLGANIDASIEICERVDGALRSSCAYGAGYVIDQIEDCANVGEERFERECRAGYLVIRGRSDRSP